MAVARLSGLLLFKLLYTEANEGEFSKYTRYSLEQDHKKYPTVGGCLLTLDKVPRAFSFIKLEFLITLNFDLI